MTTPAMGITETPVPECPECGGCDMVETDCDHKAWECHTVVILDGAGDPDVRVCRREFEDLYHPAIVNRPAPQYPVCPGRSGGHQITKGYQAGGDGWYCSLAPGHDGEHAAYDLNVVRPINLIARWV